MMDRTKKIFFVLIVILALVVFLVIIVILSPKTKNNLSKYWSVNSFNTNRQDSVSNPNLIRDYERQVKKILEPFFQEQNFDEVLKQLLELTVPAEYQDLHLNLVIAFDLIKVGQENSDQAQIEEGLAKIDNLLAQYPWLK